MAKMPNDQWVDRRQEGGSEIGIERAQKIVDAFEALVGVHVQYATDFFTGMRVQTREVINRLLEKVGLDGFVEPIPLVKKIAIPSFRKDDSLEDVKRVVLQAYEKMSSGVLDDLSGRAWDQEISYMRRCFSVIAEMAHLDRRYKGKVSKVDLESGG